MVLLLEKVHLERKDGKEFVDIATDILDAILFPCPDLRGYIVIDGYFCLGFYIFGNVEIKAGIIDKDDTIRMPHQDIQLAHPHILQNGWKMEQNGNEAHIGKFPIVFHQRAAYRCHQVAAKETKVCFFVNFFQRLHQAMR